MSIEILLAGNAESMEETEERLRLCSRGDPFVIARQEYDPQVDWKLGYTVVYFILSNAREETDLQALLDKSEGRRVNVVVQTAKDRAELALAWVEKGVFWVVTPDDLLNTARITAIIRAAGSSPESRSGLYQDLRASSPPGSNRVSNHRMKYFVSMNLRDDHEDSDAYNNALRPLERYLHADIKNAQDHPDTGNQSLEQRIAGHIEDAEVYIAFLSPTGRMSERHFLQSLLKHVPLLKELTENATPSGEEFKKFDKERLAEALKHADDIKPNHLFLQSPSVMWEVGYACALKKTIVLLKKTRYAGFNYEPPAMARASYRIEFESHTDLALRLYFGLRSSLTGSG